MDQLRDGNCNPVQQTVACPCPLHHLFFSEKQISYTMDTNNGVTHNNLEENIWKILYFTVSLTVCIWIRFCYFFFFYYIVSTWNSLLSLIICKRTSFRKLVCPAIFAYLRTPDDYLDSSVLLASETWDSCLWKCKNIQNLKTAVNLALKHLILLSHHSLWLMRSSCCTSCSLQMWNPILEIKSNRHQ